MTRPESVLIVGMGGLGCPATLALAQAGIRRMTLLDPDLVEASNLHRQLWHHSNDIGRPKVESASKKLRKDFPGVEVTTARVRIDDSNVDLWVARHDWVLDATDGVEVKFLLSDACVRASKRLVYGGVVGFEGQAMRVEWPGPCLRCLFEAPPAPSSVPVCGQVGVMGSMAGVIGSLQARLLMLPQTEEPTSELYRFDGHSLRGRKSTIRRRDDCEMCNKINSLADSQKGGKPKAEAFSNLTSPTARVDITQKVCPMTYVYTKLALEPLRLGNLLEVTLRGAEPLENLPRQARNEGHEVLLCETLPSGDHRLLIKKGERKL